MNPKYALHYASSTEIARRHEGLKWRLKIANLICLASWLGIAQFFVIPALFCKGGDPFTSKIAKGHYYVFPKGGGQQELTLGQYCVSWLSGILFVSCFPICGAAAFTTNKIAAEIKKIEPRLG